MVILCMQIKQLFLTFHMWHRNWWQNEIDLAQQLQYKVHRISLILQVDEAIQPGLTSLNWTSLNIDKYLGRIDKALGKQKIQWDQCPTFWHVRHPTTRHWRHLHSWIHCSLTVCVYVFISNSHTIYSICCPSLLHISFSLFSFYKFAASSSLSPSLSACHHFFLQHCSVSFSFSLLCS